MSQLSATFYLKEKKQLRTLPNFVELSIRKLKTSPQNDTTQSQLPTPQHVVPLPGGSLAQDQLKYTLFLHPFYPSCAIRFLRCTSFVSVTDKPTPCLADSLRHETSCKARHKESSLKVFKPCVVLRSLTHCGVG